jgi:hypothetical protein
MPASGASEILLVRAVEETRPDAIRPEALVDATLAAGGAEDERAWFERRAGWLVEHELEGQRSLLALPRALSLRLAWVAIGSFAVGLAADYLGSAPQGRIHVVWNPLVVLVAWNVLVYVALAGRAVWDLVRGRPEAAPPPAAREAAGAFERGDAAAGSRGVVPRAAADPPRLRAGVTSSLTRWLLHRVVLTLWLRAHRTARGTGERVQGYAQVGRRFWELWSGAARPLVAQRTRQALHVAAIGLALGALVGVFARGVFFEYDVVWRSTFVQSPTTARNVLAALFGPAAFALGRTPPTLDAAQALMTEEGLPAAPWIELYAVSALLFIVAPRTLLALIAGWRVRRTTRALDLGLEREPYYRRILQTAREVRVAQLVDEIRADVQTATDEFAAGIAEFVAVDLYDAHIVPHMQRYRVEGGRVQDLQQRIAQECETFAPALQAQVPEARKGFERSLAQAVGRRLELQLGDDVPEREDALGTRVGDASQTAAQSAGGRFGTELADAIGAVVSGAVAVVAGTLAGGFGHTLGAAVLVALLGTSGPVGFVIGAIGGLIVAGGAFALGRDRVADAAARISVPGPVLRTILSAARLQKLIDGGRQQTREAVRSAIAAELEPLAPEMADQIWRRVKPIVGERQRGAPLPESAPAT